jgi:hypothetical protein
VHLHVINIQATDALLECPGLEYVVAHGVLRLLKSPALRTHPLSPATWHVLANVCTLCAKPSSAGAALLDGLEGLLAPGECWIRREGPGVYGSLGLAPC